MTEHPIQRAATTEGLPVSPSLGPSLEMVHVPVRSSLVDGRVVWIAAGSVGLAAVAAVMAKALMDLIALVTNLSFYGKFSVAAASPAGNHLGAWVLGVPVIGGIIVGLMARYGSAAIRGHGIPEAMEQVLLNKSRIPARLTLLKPVSAAVAIGTGGPFGAEGPIIATGGALGSLMGQWLPVTADERKTLLAAGAAAGMAATFGCPVSALLLAIELLLFEFRPRSFLPVALASATAAGVRVAIGEPYPMFHMPDLLQPAGAALAVYVLLGAVMGVASVLVTRVVYRIEDLFEHSPVHWMWWPAIGAVAVGAIGYWSPRSMGVGYDNISDLISFRLTLGAAAVLCLAKWVSWSISLGSGTSGGTLAPLFTIGAGVGTLLGAAAQHLLPQAGIDLRIAALVGMASIFAGASRALLASVVFAFETTLQPLGLLPLLGGCSASYLISCLLMRHSIMTEKIARRGVSAPVEYAADFLAHVLVKEAATRPAVTLEFDQPAGRAAAWINSGQPGSEHQGFPVLDPQGRLTGVLTRRDLLDPAADPRQPLGRLLQRPPVVVYEDCTLREAADHMVNHDVGRLPVIDRTSGRLVGIITRSDLLKAHRTRLERIRQETVSQPAASESAR